MKYTSILLLVALAACGDSKPAPKIAPVNQPNPVADAPTKPADIVATEPVVTPAVAVETANSGEDVSVAALTKIPLEEAAKSTDDKAASSKETPAAEVGIAKSSDASHVNSADAGKSADAAKSADVVAAVPAKVEELSVQVLQEGTGAVVKRGDMVTLEYTISYMPKPGADKKDDAKKKDSKSSKKSDTKKSDDKKSAEKKTDDAKPKDESKDGDKPTDEKKEPAASEHKDEAVAKIDDKTADKTAEKHADDKAADVKTTDSKPSETKPSDTDAKVGETKSGDSKTADAKSSDAHADEAKVAEAKTGEKKNGDTKTADSKSGDAKSADSKAGSKSVEAKPIDPLAPVIVASTKSFTTPFTVKLTENGKPKLMPGLVRGVEGLKVGTRARIMVPAALAYGKDGNKSAGIPAETTVEIEVFVKDARE